MNLKNNNITVSEIMSNPQAKKYLLDELAGIINPQMLAFASNMTLKNVLAFAEGRISKEKICIMLKKLEEF